MGLTRWTTSATTATTATSATTATTATTNEIKYVVQKEAEKQYFSIRPYFTAQNEVP